MNPSKSFAQNTAIQIGGKMLAVLLGVYTVSLLTTYLGTEGYGHLTIALNYLAIFAVVVDFGLTLTTVQMISEKEAQEERLLANLMSLRIISAGIFLALAPIIAIAFPYDQIVKTAIVIGAFSYLIGTSAQLLIGIFQKRMIISRAVIAELANRIVVFAGAYFATQLGLSLIGIMWLFVFGNASQLIAITLFARQHLRLRLKIELPVWRDILARSWPIGASIFFNLIYLRGDILFLSLYRSASEVGLYGAAYKVVDVITVIPVMYMGLLLPQLVRDWGNGAKDAFKKSLQQAVDFFAIVAIPFAVGSILVGVPLMEFISTEDFTDSGRVLALLGPAASIVFFGSLFGHAIVGINKQKTMVFGYAAVAALTVVGYIVFIPQYGMWAAAWWTVISEALITVITFIVVSRTARFLPDLRMSARAAAASIVMGVVIALLPKWHVAITIGIGCFVYYVILSALGGPKLKDAAQLFLPEKAPISVP